MSQVKSDYFSCRLLFSMSFARLRPFAAKVFIITTVHIYSMDTPLPTMFTQQISLTQGHSMKCNINLLPHQPSEPDNDSRNDASAISPTLPTAKCPHDARKEFTHSGTDDTTPSNDYEKHYVKIDPDYTLYHTWSNESGDLNMYRVFSEEEPNLSSDFNVKGLKPTVKDSYCEMFLLTDSNGNFYLWDPWDGHLLRPPHKWTAKEDLTKYEGKVYNIVQACTGC